MRTIATAATGPDSAVRLSATHRYSVSPAELYAQFVDSDSVGKKHAALGGRNVEVECSDADESGADVRIRREMPAKVPGLLSKFLQPWNDVVQHETWTRTADGGYRAELDIDIRNVPVDITGSLNISGDARNCENRVVLKIDCGIPFVGKTLAEFVAGDCRRLMAAEYDYLQRELA